MKRFRISSLSMSALIFILGAALTQSVGFAKDNMEHTSTVFKGAKVNGGTVTHIRAGNKSILKLSPDFKIPDTPDPHWQVIDSKGESHLLQALKVKDGLTNLEITLPGHVPDVAKVQIWCAFAQVLLGESSFARPVR
jgi:hypothetical protein